jgi:serine/threonine protein kinase
MAARHVPIGQPVHEAEAHGIRILVSALPDSYVVYTNVELPTGRPGQTLEHDAVVIAPYGVYTVELKSWGGRIQGNRDRWTLADGTLAQSPIPLVNYKAKLLKSLLKSKRIDLDRDLHVQGLIFLSAGNATPTITPDYADFVVTRPDLRAALTDRTRYDFRGALSDNQRKAIEAVLADDKAPRRQSDRLGDYHLVQRLLTDDRPYEAWLGRQNLTQEVRVLHAYAISGQDEREQARARARALREATLHSRLIGGRDLLRYHDYFITSDDPQRIVLIFEDTTPLRVLESWAKDLSPGLTARLKVMARVARALDVLHNRELVHRRLSLEAILVSRQEDPHDVRLCAVDLARDLTGRVPTITSDSIDPTASRFSAPDLVRTGEASPQSDIFSLGAVCFELFTGRQLFQSVDELLRPFEVPSMYIGDRPVPPTIADLVRQMLDPRPERRPTSAEDVAVAIENYLADQHRADRRTDPAPGTVLRETYELKQRLGHGATATTWLVEHLQTRSRLVLKLGEARHAARLRHESMVLERAAHPNLVRYFNIEPHDSGCMLVLSYAEGVSAATWAGAGDPLTAEQLHRLAKGLLDALQALHDAGYIHRDVKPDNVILAEPGARPTLIDVGIACPIDQEGDLAVGTVHYKDPLVYSESRWTPANDQFAAFLVLYEVLTGAHPFGGPPDADRRPAIVIDDLPDTLSDDQKRDLAALFTRALAPERAARPASLAQALAELRTALRLDVPAPQPAAAHTSGPPRPPPPPPPVDPPPPPPPPRIPADATLDTQISALDLSARTHSALVRFGVTTLRQLGRIDPDSCRRRGVGRKTIDDLRSLHRELHARFPGQFDAEFSPEPPPPFFPPLVGDPRPLDELAPSLTTGILAALRAMGLRTLGELASTPAAAITEIDHLGPDKLARMRQGLLKLSGQVSGPDTLEALDDLLREELGDRPHAMLAAVFGLHDGNLLSLSEAGAQLDVSRQRVSQAVDLAALRLGASHGRTLVELLDSVLPPVGFTTLAHAIEALALRLPAVDPRKVSHLGYTRLAALLLRPDGLTAERRDIDLVFRPPWTAASIAALRGRLAALANWPPYPRPRAERDLWDMLDEPGQRALVRFGADAPQLVDAVLRLGADVLADPVGGLYTPPVALHDALILLRPQLGRPRLDADTLVSEATAAFKGLEIPPDAAARDRAIERAGFRRDGDRWIDPDRVQTPEPPLVPSVDRAIPRQTVRDDSQPPVVEALVAAAARGGFRVVAMAPATHHIQSRQLARWLAQALGEDRVHTVAVDRVLLDALKHAGQWDYARHYEARPEADWRWSHAALTSALNEAVAPAKPGQVTVLTQPALLGTLGLMPWLSGFYDRARGGRFGLIVLAIPGGVHDNRVRLNERFNLPYTPDMAAVYLEAP